MDEISELLWDEQNVAHIARHKVTPDEVNQVVFSPDAVTREVPQERRPGRLAIFGPTDNGRLLAVFLDKPARGRSYVLTARRMNTREIRTYRIVKENPDDQID